MSTVPSILSRYIGRHFLSYSLIVLFLFAGLITLFDFVEILRSSHGKDVPIRILVEMTLLKLPTILQKVIPFIVMLASLLAYTRLTKTSELIVARAAGVSVWQFLMPTLVISATIGLLIMAVFNPLSAVMLERNDTLKNKYFGKTKSTLSVSSTGLWLRQSSNTAGGKVIIHARKISDTGQQLQDVVAYRLNSSDRLVDRIMSKSAKLEPGYWLLKDAVLIVPGRKAKKLGDYKLPSDIILDGIQESFTPPESIPFWKLPKFIASIKSAGFSALEHRLHLHNLMATPFMLCAMVMFAVAFSFRLPRSGKIGAMMSLGIFTGFIVYFLSDLVAAFGLSGSIPVPMAAWSPAAISLLAGTSLLLHLEDG